MPYRFKRSADAYQRDRRARLKAEKAEAEKTAEPPLPADPAAAVADWSRECLVVSPGHPRAGQPMELPAFGVKWLREAYQPGIREAALFIARKNAKSSVCAVLALAHLVGPLRRFGWRCGTASLSRDKAVELWKLMEAVAIASGLEGLTFGKVPRHVASAFGTVDFLSADKTAAEASGFDLVLADEVGLWREDRGAELIESLLSAVGAKDGRALYISVQADSELTMDLRTRAETDPAVHVTCYEAPKDCTLDDEAAWHKANPGIAEGIKSLDYMRDRARRAKGNPRHALALRWRDLNQRVSTSYELIVELSDYEACEAFGPALPEGPFCLGIDAGGSRSMSAAVAYWPETGRLEVWGAFAKIPNLEEREEADNVPERYQHMQEAGELRLFGERVTDLGEFLSWVASELPGPPMKCGADRYRQAEVENGLQNAGLTGEWAMEWRGVGATKEADQDIRAFQRLFESHEARPPKDSMMLLSGIEQARMEYDNRGNPHLRKGKNRSRIDVIQAGCIAVGLGAFIEEHQPAEIIHRPFA